MCIQPCKSRELLYVPVFNDISQCSFILFSFHLHKKVAGFKILQVNPFRMAEESSCNAADVASAYKDLVSAEQYATVS